MDSLGAFAAGIELRRALCRRVDLGRHKREVAALAGASSANAIEVPAIEEYAQLPEAEAVEFERRVHEHLDLSRVPRAVKRRCY